MRYLTAILCLLLIAITADAGCGNGLFSRMRANRDARVAARQGPVVRSVTVIRSSSYQWQAVPAQAPKVVPPKK